MEDLQDQIDAYLTGRLEGAGKAAFEQRLQEDLALAEEVSKQRDVLHVLETVEDSKWKARLVKIHEEHQQNQAKSDGVIVEVRKKRQLYIGLSIAAAVFMILCLVFLTQQARPPAKSLYASFYTPYPLSFTDRGEGNEALKASASQAYLTEDFTGAIEKFRMLRSREPLPVYDLALAICFLETSVTDSAEILFRSLREDPLYDEAAQWYWALTLLKQSQVADCRRALESIEEEMEFYEEAQLLLAQLP